MQWCLIHAEIDREVIARDVFVRSSSTWSSKHWECTECDDADSAPWAQPNMFNLCLSVSYAAGSRRTVGKGDMDFAA